MRRDKQRSQLEGVRQELPILDGERQIEADFPPVGHAVGEFRRPVDAMMGDEAPRKRRLLLPERDIVEVLLNRELADGGNAGVIDLDFVDGLCRLPQHDGESRPGQQAETPPQAVSETAFHHCNARLRRPDQNSDREHDGTAEHDLERRLQEGRVHISRANVGDGPQLEEHDHARNRGRDPERVGP